MCLVGWYEGRYRNQAKKMRLLCVHFIGGFKVEVQHWVEKS